MRFTAAITASLLLAASTYAQSSSETASAAARAPSAASSGTTVHVIEVSNTAGDLLFTPNSIQAAPGDMIQWQFYPKNHSVVMSSFAQPCVPIQESDPANATNAFFSGFMPVSDASNGGKLTYTVMVKDTKPIWYYCAQAKHCQAGMVGVINPPANSPNTIEAFAASAKNAPNNVAPGGSTAGGTASSGTASGASSTSPAATQSGNATVGSNGASALNAAGVGLPGIIALAAAVFFML